MGTTHVEQEVYWKAEEDEEEQEEEISTLKCRTAKKTVSYDLHGEDDDQLKIVEPERSIYLDKNDGTESNNGTNGMKDNVVVEEKFGNGDSNPTTNGTTKRNGTDSNNGTSGMKDIVIANAVAVDRLVNGGSDVVSNGIDTVKNLAAKSAKGVNGSEVTTNGVEILKALAIESINGTGEVNSVVEHFSDEQKLGGGDTDVATEKSVASETDNLSHNNLEEEQSGVHLIGSSANEITSLNPSDNPNLKSVEESKQEVPEWDVERVIDEQETHDLYCPNCHSCITKRVILRKRKRRLQTPEQGKKPNIFGLGQSSSLATSDQAHEIAPSAVDANSSAADTSTQDRVEEPDVFRCLSCFSFFIPSVSIFKSFRIFGNRGARDSGQIVEQTPGAGEDLTHNSNEVGIEEINSQYSPNIQNNQTSLATRDTDLTQPLLSATSEPQEGVNDIGFSSTTTSSTTTSSTTTSSKTTSVIHETGAKETPYTTVTMNKEDNKTSTFSSETTTPQSHVSTTSVSVHHEETRFNNSEDKDTNKKVEGGHSWILDQHTRPQFTGIFSANPQVPQVEYLKDGKDISVYEPLLSKDNHIGIGKDLEDLPTSTGAGKDVIVVIETETTSTETSQSAGVPIPDVLNAYGTGQQVDRDNVSDRWEIVKSIVYGGLVESITSLSVVSSAAGGGAGTLNIFALGLANLFGGLFIIVHGLVDLKREQYDGDHTQAKHMDRYHELLGNKRRFTLHATVAILSYIIFGLVSPLTYGFSFRVTDNKEYKLIAVAVAALVCITLLAIAKAYKQKPPKSYAKTVFLYICIGVMSSGVSYVVGVFVKKLLERLGLFEASMVDPVQPSGFGFIESAAGKSSWAAF